MLHQLSHYATDGGGALPMPSHFPHHARHMPAMDRLPPLHEYLPGKHPSSASRYLHAEDSEEEQVVGSCTPPLSPLRAAAASRVPDEPKRHEQLLDWVRSLSASVAELSRHAQTVGLSAEQRAELSSQLKALTEYASGLRYPDEIAPDHDDKHEHHRSAQERGSAPSPPLYSLKREREEGAPDFHAQQQKDSSITHKKKRAKRTFSRSCFHCGTQYTSQWRKGPAGASTLCNACGIRYARRLKKDVKEKEKPSSAPRSSVYSLLN